MFESVINEILIDPSTNRCLPSEEIGLVGLHFGADCCTAAFSAIITTSATHPTAPLYFDDNRTTYLPYTLPTLPNMVFHHILQLPGDALLERYEGDWSLPTYADILKAVFTDAVNKLLKHNPVLKARGRILFFVNRPNGELWARREQEYQQLLQSCLNIDGNTGKLFVLPYGEAQAIMAQGYKANTILPYEKLLIVNCEGGEFSAMPVIASCDSTPKPPVYQGTMTATTDNFREFLDQVRQCFGEYLPLRFVLHSTCSAESEPMIRDLFPESTLTKLNAGHIAHGLAFAAAVELLKHRAYYLAPKKIACLDLSGLHCDLYTVFTDKAIETLSQTLSSGWNSHAQSFAQALLTPMQYRFPYDELLTAVNKRLQHTVDSDVAGILNEYSEFTKLFLKQFPWNNVGRGFQPAIWEFSVKKNHLQESLTPYRTDWSQITYTEDQLLGVTFKFFSTDIRKHLVNDYPLTGSEAEELRTKVNNRLKYEIKTDVRLYFTSKTKEGAEILKDRIGELFLASLKEYLELYTPFALHGEEDYNRITEGVLA